MGYRYLLFVMNDVSPNVLSTPTQTTQNACNLFMCVSLVVRTTTQKPPEG
jgi:hypothetical protein